MKNILVFICSILITFSLFASGYEEAKSRCSQPAADEPILFSDDFFGWGLNMEQAKKASELAYASNKRLKERAYFDGENFVFPNAIYNSPVLVRIPKNFISSIIKHVESALKRNYVDFIIFPDMGHSHYFIPEDFYNNVLDKFADNEKHLRLEAMMAYPGLKILYHTAEQIKMKDEDKNLINDRHLQWRFYTRNIVGDNQEQGHLEIIHASDHGYNTAHDYEEGYRYWGAGFNISANENGCFPFLYNGQTYYFDLSLKDLEAGNINNSGDL